MSGFSTISMPRFLTSARARASSASNSLSNQARASSAASMIAF